MVRATATGVLALMGATGALAAPRLASHTLISRDGEIVPTVPVAGILSRRGGPAEHETFQDADFSSKPYPISAPFSEAGANAAPMDNDKDAPVGKDQPTFGAQALPPFLPEAGAGGKGGEAFPPLGGKDSPPPFAPAGGNFPPTGGNYDNSQFAAFPPAGPGGKEQPPFGGAGPSFPPAAGAGDKGPFPPAGAFPPAGGVGGKGGLPEDLSDGEEDGPGAGEDAKAPGAGGAGPAFPPAGGAGGKGGFPGDLSDGEEDGPGAGEDAKAPGAGGVGPGLPPPGGAGPGLPPPGGAGGNGGFPEDLSDGEEGGPGAGEDAKAPGAGGVGPGLPPPGGAGGKGGFPEDLSDGEEDGPGAGEDAKAPGADGAGGPPDQDGKPGEDLPPSGDEKPAGAGELDGPGEAPAPDDGGASSDEDEAPAGGEPPAEGNRTPAFDDPELAAKIDKNAPGFQNVGTGEGKQFITGECISDADCESGCCAGLNGMGVCSGNLTAFDEGKQGCHFKLET